LELELTKPKLDPPKRMMTWEGELHLHLALDPGTVLGDLVLPLLLGGAVRELALQTGSGSIEDLQLHLGADIF
jgi:hypothetical protein